MQLSEQADEALLSLLGELGRTGYDFVAVTPETHRRILARPDRQLARDLRDILGWNLPFAAETLSPLIAQLLDDADAIERQDGLLRSKVRIASLDGGLYLHSAFPTDDSDSVFFGPDSYRFASFVRSELRNCSGATRLIDLGTGSGVGAVTAASILPDARLTLVDINPLALRLAAINALHAGLDVDLVQASSIDELGGTIELVIANPPYIADEDGRSYRDGGDMHGAKLSLDWALGVARRLKAGGRMLLYTGSAIVAGQDALRMALEAELPRLGCRLDYCELDPDVFGEELEQPAYADAERIAVVGAVIKKI